MQYMGSKRRIATHILPIILKDRQEGQWFVEPFSGGCNITDKVEGKRIANDKNEYVISLFKAVQNGWTPPENISEEFYKEIKENKDKYCKSLVGFVGFGCSFGGKWFGGYARNNKNDNYTKISRISIFRSELARVENI